LAFLIPAEAAVRDRFRADELERAEQRIAFGNQEGLAQDRNFNQFFVWTEEFGHKWRARVCHWNESPAKEAKAQRNAEQ
jgi:hypothetical protein